MLASRRLAACAFALVLCCPSVANATPPTLPPLVRVTACLSFVDGTAQLNAWGLSSWDRFVKVMDEFEVPPLEINMLIDPRHPRTVGFRLDTRAIGSALAVVQERGVFLAERLTAARPNWAGLQITLEVSNLSDYSSSRCNARLSLRLPSHLVPSLCPETKDGNCRVTCDSYACERW
jgi:hypothetical protein